MVGGVCTSGKRDTAGSGWDWPGVRARRSGIGVVFTNFTGVFTGVFASINDIGVCNGTRTSGTVVWLTGDCVSGTGPCPTGIGRCTNGIGV